MWLQMVSTMRTAIWKMAALLEVGTNSFHHCTMFEAFGFTGIDRFFALSGLPTSIVIQTAWPT